MSSIRRLCARARRRRGDDGVALLMSMALIAIFTTLMLSMLALVLGQVKPTAQARKDVGAVNAASSGLQAGLALIRRSVDAGSGDGSREGLPCTGTATTTTTFRTGTGTVSTPGASISGAAATALPGDFRYQVSIAYYSDDPTDRSLDWLRTNARPCPLTDQPKYAYLQSYGTGSNVAGAGGGTGNRGNRSQTGVYQFSVPAANIAGGRLVQIGQNLCVDAGASPGVGSALTFQTCEPLGLPRQTWQYRQDLTLFYGGAPALDLCVQGTRGGTTTLQRCTGAGDDATYTPGSTPYAPGQQAQEWSYNDDGHFAAAANDGNVTGDCLQPTAFGSGASLGVDACQGSTDDYRGFNPDAAVGAGKAGGNETGVPGSPTNQYVNFAQFGRCLDVTNQDRDVSFLIAYPCKQAPDSTKLTWNQVWAFHAISGTLGTFSTSPPQGPYCLTTPLTDVHPNVTPCVDGQQRQQWYAVGQVAGSPGTSYTLRSASRPDQCLSLSAAESQWGAAKIVLESCNGSTRQRWNAPPPLPPAGLSSIAEGSTPP